MARRRFRRASRVPAIFVAALTGQNPWFYLAGGPGLSQHRHISEFHSSWTLDHSLASDLRRRTETTPGKHSDARIKPLPLTNGHGRYITAAPERALVSVGEWPLHAAVINLQPIHSRNGFATAVSLLKPPCGGFKRETTTWIQKWLKISVGNSRELYL